MNDIGSRLAPQFRSIAPPEIDERAATADGLADFATELQRFTAQSALRHAMVQFRVTQWTAVKALKQDLTQK